MEHKEIRLKVHVVRQPSARARPEERVVRPHHQGVVPYQQTAVRRSRLQEIQPDRTQTQNWHPYNICPPTEMKGTAAQHANSRQYAHPSGTRTGKRQAAKDNGQR